MLPSQHTPCQPTAIQTSQGRMPMTQGPHSCSCCLLISGELPLALTPILQSYQLSFLVNFLHIVVFLLYLLFCQFGYLFCLSTLSQTTVTTMQKSCRSAVLQVGSGATQLKSIGAHFLQLILSIHSTARRNPALLQCRIALPEADEALLTLTSQSSFCLCRCLCRCLQSHHCGVQHVKKLCSSPEALL